MVEGGLLPQYDCGIPSIQFDPSPAVLARIRQHWESETPLRITGVGQWLAETHIGLFKFAATSRLAKWGKMRFEVGDIPYAGNFRDEEPVELSFGEYLAMVNRSQPDTAGKYWFSQHLISEYRASPPASNHDYA